MSAAQILVDTILKNLPVRRYQRSGVGAGLLVLGRR